MQRKIAGKWPYIILMAVIVVAIILVAVLGARNVNLAPVYGIVLTAGLVGITAIYVYETGRIAKANSRMAEEMEKTRFAAYRPILSIDNSSIQDLFPEQKIRIGLLGERGEFPYFWPCNISNVGGGPALDVKWLVHHGDKPLSWTASVIGKDSVVKNGPHKLSLEDIKGQTDRKVIRLRYKDIFGNGFESSRQVWLEGANPVIGPLQISPIQKEEE